MLLLEEDACTPPAGRRGGFVLVARVTEFTEGVTAELCVDAESEAVEASSMSRGGVAVEATSIEPTCMVDPRMDLAASPILPRPFLATLNVFLVVCVSRLPVEEESSLPNKCVALDFAVGGKEGNILPHRVPPNTFCVANDSSSHFKSAMDRRTTMVDEESTEGLGMPSLA